MPRGFHDRHLIAARVPRNLPVSRCQSLTTGAHQPRDRPWGQFQATVFIEIYRVKCPQCGVKREKVLQLPTKAPFPKRLEDAVGLACQSAAARQVGVDEIHLGKQQRFLTAVCNLETGEPLWFGRERKKETLDQ